ncbi:hypothetical protein KAFR_0I01780 [Kazachstania africana CBS 2517]|uniref:Hyphally-regulated cell wall protein N-terminal domain-containing protein n=1 Tax=Kazachstania africana (strain ATCC 22294 / BCRC 22015 / CBS 2517 / CECT 1963 / NBRC 1671 / NRRL Y-8276) TaxID=1071382 RepID=H2B009_KAZAF|nr:hypothetical protein KAFR_0I01780 [Kazachstania africana CBS 2517]CCF59959.1 hypothetical protein KAFR_0I01780 [Kazachstania africana CBS 2517]
MGLLSHSLISKAFLLSCVFAYAFATYSFSGNTAIDGITFFPLAASVTSGSTLLIQSGILHYFLSTLTNYGKLYICETSSWDIGMSVLGYGSFYNYGTFMVDDTEALTAVNVKFSGDVFTNDGDIFVTSKGYLLNGATVKFTSSDWTNTGLININQDSGSALLSDVELGGGDKWIIFGQDHIVNTGTICVTNVKYNQYAAMSGQGCIDVGEDAVLYLDHTIPRDMSSQTIFMSSSSSTVTIKNTLGYSTLTVRGFGDGNVINFPFVIIYHSYNSSSGILTVVSAALLMYIDIGTGYDSNDFELTNNGLILFGAIKYTGSVPDSTRPSVCSVCTAAPSCSDITASSYSTMSNSFTEVTLPDAYTTTVSDESETATELISFYYTTDNGGSSIIDATTYIVSGSSIMEMSSGVVSSNASHSTIIEPSTSATVSISSTAITTSDSTESVAVSEGVSTSVDNGKTVTVTVGESSTTTASSASSAFSSSVSSAPASSSSSSSGAAALTTYTTTATNGGSTSTYVVVEYTTTDSVGATLTSEVTYTVGAESTETLSAYTTTIVSGGTSETVVVSEYVTVDSEGSVYTTCTTYEVGASGSGSSYTTTVTAGVSTEVVVICTCTLTKSNGETVSTLTTFPATSTPTDMSGESYTTTLVHGGTVTEYVMCDYESTNSAGAVVTSHSTVSTIAAGNDYTTTVVSNGVTSTVTVCECTFTNAQGATYVSHSTRSATETQPLATEAAEAKSSSQGTTTVTAVQSVADTTTKIETLTASSKAVSEAVTTAAQVSAYEGKAANLKLGGLFIALASTFFLFV